MKRFLFFSLFTLLFAFFFLFCLKSPAITRAILKTMEKETEQKKRITIKFDPEDSIVFRSIVTAPSGNKSIFKLINEKDAPDFVQRVK